MNTIVLIAGWILIGLVILTVVLYPTWIGRERGEYNVTGWICMIIQCVLITIVVGRVFGWW